MLFLLSHRDAPTFKVLQVPTNGTADVWWRSTSTSKACATCG